MKEPIERIRGFLSRRKQETETAPAGDGSARPAEQSARDQSGAEAHLSPPAHLPGVNMPGVNMLSPNIVTLVEEIIDDLQPLLPPYQAAFYWYLFRHSILKNGSPLIRTGCGKLRRGVVKPQRGMTVGLTQVSQYLKDLEYIGAIRRMGETDNSGTPYRVLLPGEIEVCLKYRAERTERRRVVELAESEIDYYNIRENRLKVYLRDEYKCRYCGKQLTLLTATLDHITAVAAGGGNDLDNLATACLMCNSQKRKRPVGDFLAERSTKPSPEPSREPSGEPSGELDEN